MERAEQMRIAEALILGSPEPISHQRLAGIIPDLKPTAAKELVNELNEIYNQQDRAFEIWEVAGGYQIRTRAEFSGYLQKLHKQRPVRLSRAALETLAIIAFKQPVTRAEIEQVRAVDAGAVVKNLLDRQLVKIAGQREVPGRPMIYSTTRRFLEVFGLDSLKDLPSLRELEDIARESGLAEPDDGEGAGALEEADSADSAEATDSPEELVVIGEAPEAPAEDEESEPANPESSPPFAEAASGSLDEEEREA